MDFDFSSIFKDAPVPAMVLDRSLCFVTANDVYLTNVDKTLDDITGGYVFDVFPEEAERVEAMLDVFQRTLQGERPVFREIPFTILKDGQPIERWWTASHAPIRNSAGEITHLVQYSEDVTDQVRLRQMKEAVMGEMQHRIGNYFTIVQAIARQISRSAQSVEEFSETFSERLASFFKMQKLLNTDSGEHDTLETVIRSQLAFYAPEALERIRIDGPQVHLSMLEAQAVSMAIHELSANSLKYGAIRNPSGTLSVTWQVDGDDRVDLCWQEDGIEADAGKTGEGYGTMLLKVLLPRQLNGAATLRCESPHFRYDLSIGRATT